MTRSRVIIMTVRKKTGDAFDAILQVLPKMMPDAQKGTDGWWSFTGPFGKAKLKFNENKSLEILDHQYVDETSKWDVPMRVVSNGDYSEVVVTLNKPEELSDSQFDERVTEIDELFKTMKNIIESD